MVATKAMVSTVATASFSNEAMSSKHESIFSLGISSSTRVEHMMHTLLDTFDET